MTIDEAIEWLNTDDYLSAGYNEALDMAIQALLAVDVRETNVSDVVRRQDAIDAIMGQPPEPHYPSWYAEQIEKLPSAQQEPSTDIQDVLGYLDDVLHPLVSPDNWNVYSELHDMISRLPPAQQWIPCTKRLPKPNEYIGSVRKYYLIQNEYGDMMCCSWDGIKWNQIYQHEPIDDSIVAWRPLPSPFEGGEA